MQEPFRRQPYHLGTALGREILNPPFNMHSLLGLQPVAAIGYSILYMVFGGGLFGAVVVFFIAKMFGK